MNVLWITTTQWRAQATRYAGDANARTPFLDALRARACDYIQAVTPHPFGPFARAALLTGIESPENGVKNYFDPLPLETKTAAHRFQEQGYLTAFFGKWHLAPRDSTAPLVGEVHARTLVAEERRGGFHFWEGFEGGFQLDDPLLHGTRLREPTRFAGYQSDVVCGRAADWLGEQKQRRWFTMVSLEPPHPPYAVSSLGTAGSDVPIALRANVPRSPAISNRAERDLAGYYSQIEATDRAIGRLIERISLADTLVVFTSVHGDMHGSHGVFRKGWPYEESVRVPLLISVPGGKRMERTEPISLTQLLDLSLRTVATGEIPIIPNEFAKISMPSVVALTDQCDRVWKGVRNAERKLIVNEDGSPWLFFDLGKDPLELKNLVSEPSAASEVGRMLARIH